MRLYITEKKNFVVNNLDDDNPVINEALIIGQGK